MLGLVLVGMILFPPFMYQSAYMKVGAGFSFIGSPPHSAQSNTCAIVNIQQLVLQILAVIVAGGVFVAALKK